MAQRLLALILILVVAPAAAWVQTNGPSLPASSLDRLLPDAAREGHAHATAQLLAQRADANAGSESRLTALMLAANRGLATLVEQLIAVGADANIEARDGWTAAAAAEVVG